LLSELLTNGQTSSAEVVAAHLEWIAEHNPAINAIVQLAAARASNEATHLDEGTRRSSDSPLRGLPFTIKDNFETQQRACARCRQSRLGENDARETW
jgi:Asp-tRNA(Asn)/Glu-tRNA(Gln) amidotransferase A subunit family amidase